MQVCDRVSSFFSLLFLLCRCPSVEKAVADLFYECNIPFRVAETAPFLNFMHAVCPSVYSSGTPCFMFSFLTFFRRCDCAQPSTNWWCPPERCILKDGGTVEEQVAEQVGDNESGLLVNSLQLPTHWCALARILLSLLSIASISGLAIGDILIGLVEERQSHTAEKLAQICSDAITKMESSYGLQVVAVVADGCSSMTLMRELVEQRRSVLSCRCLAHLLNLCIGDFFKHNGRKAVKDGVVCRKPLCINCLVSNFFPGGCVKSFQKRPSPFQ